MFDMTNEGYPHGFDGMPLPKVKKVKPLKFWDFAFQLLFLALFFLCVQLYYSNLQLEAELEKKHNIIMGLAKLK